MISLRKKYTQTLAIFLLALYAFVATPTAIWHAHATQKTHTSFVDSAGSFSDDDMNNFSEDCSVCGHHYAIYTNDTTVYSSPFHNFFVNKQVDFPSSLRSYPQYTHSNKGPPVLS